MSINNQDREVIGKLVKAVILRCAQDPMGWVRDSSSDAEILRCAQDDMADLAR